LNVDRSKKSLPSQPLEHHWLTARFEAQGSSGMSWLSYPIIGLGAGTLGLEMTLRGVKEGLGREGKRCLKKSKS